MGNAPSAQTVFKSFKQAFDKLFGNKEMRVVMLGLDAAGKTTILYKLHIGEVLSTVPTLGTTRGKSQPPRVHEQMKVERRLEKPATSREKGCFS